MAGTFFRKVREMGRDLFPKGPRECVANAGSFRLFILTSFAGRLGKASLPKTTLRISVPAREDAPVRQGPISKRSARMAGTFFRKVCANAWRMQGRSGFSFSPHSQDASEKRPCPRRRFGKASLPMTTRCHPSPADAMLRSPAMRPIIEMFGQSGTHRVLPNIIPGGLEIGFAADPVVKIVALPDDTESVCRVALPIPDEVHHAVAGIPSERHQGMKMIGHDQREIHLPAVALMIEFKRGKNPLSYGIIREMIPAAFLAVDGDEECGVCVNPLRRTMELPSRAPCRVTVVEHGDMVSSEQNPCRFPYSIVRSGPGGQEPGGQGPFPKGPGDGQGPFSERSARRAGTFFRKVRANAWRMRGECGANAGRMQGRSGFSFSPHSQDASEKRPCLRGRFGMPRPLVAARQGSEAHSAWPQAKASLPKKMLRSMSSPLTPALPAQTSLLVITLWTIHPLKNEEIYPAKATNPLSNPP